MKIILAFTIVLVYVTADQKNDNLDIDLFNIKQGHKFVNINPNVKGNIKSSANDIQKLIVSGKIAKPKQFPYQVGLKLKSDFFFYWCGGSLISANYVLTAAHCLYSAMSAVVILGAINKDVMEKDQVRFNVSKADFIIHSSYNDYLVRNDIALIRLPKPVPLSDYIHFIALPKANIKIEGRVATASGWGRLYTDGELSSQLRYVTLKTISLKDCRYYFRILIRQTNVCADSSDGKSTCKGDSGGPFVVEENGVKTLIGLTSFGSEKGCQSGWPSVYTRVSSYLNWIQDHSDVTLQKN